MGVAKIKTKSITDSEWINNYWFIDDDLYVTDSSFDAAHKNLLGKINAENLLASMKNKKTRNSSFLINPNPITNKPLEANKSDIEVVNYYDGFVYNVFKYKKDLYISILTKKDESYVLLRNEAGKETRIKKFDNYLVAGELNDQLVLKSVKDRETYLVDPKAKELELHESKIRRIKRICYLADKYVILNDLHHLYSLIRNTEEYKTLKDDDDEITICNFDKSSFIISDRMKRETYVVNKKQQLEHICSNYFYRLDSYDKVLLIGKPLYMDDDLVESYTLPLVFID